MADEFMLVVEYVFSLSFSGSKLRMGAMAGVLRFWHWLWKAISRFEMSSIFMG